ncbi:DUF1090 domain-containing protein [Photobacterium sp. DNB22_13_2]
MKSLYALSISVLLGFSTSVLAAGCGSLKGCERKFCEIEHKLSVAQSENNEYKINGLKKALYHAKKYCTNEGLQEEIQKNIDDALEDIENYNEDLDKAKRDNRVDKIEKYQRKIDEKNKKISKLKSELAELDGL